MARRTYQLQNAQVTIDDTEFVRFFEQAPRVTFKWVRDYVGRCFGSFRRDWLKGLAGRLRLPGGTYDPESFYGGRFGLGRSFRYRVTPTQGYVPAKPNLAQISGEMSTNSPVAYGLEVGGTYGARSGRFLAIPLRRALDTLGRKKRNYRSPKIAQAAGKFFFVFKAKRTGRLYLSEYVRKGRRGSKTESARWFPTWKLVRQVSVRPLFRLIDTWKAMEPDRFRRLLETKESIRKELSTLRTGQVAAPPPGDPDG